MIVKNKTLIITDPCYIFTGKNKELLVDKSKLYTDMSAVGFTDYICVPTLYGDWTCTTYMIKENPILWLKTTDTDYNRVLGTFTADSGTVFVGPLEEAIKINPDFVDWSLKHSKCLTTIPNYTGEISIYDYGTGRHIIGTGDYNFITVQTEF